MPRRRLLNLGVLFTGLVFLALAIHRATRVEIQKGKDTIDGFLLFMLQRLKAIPTRDSFTLQGFSLSDTLHERLGSQNASPNTTAKTTAVILNWSRFNNVRLISSLLCGPWLDSIIAEVYIWNNNPIQLSHEDFKGTGCSQNKLRIHNSPTNIYFEARYIACTQSSMPYCFVQDDDYLVASEVIYSLVMRISSVSSTHTIHLLPAHEHLTTSLREIHVNYPWQRNIQTIHASSAWLGHGTILHRSEASDFLKLLYRLNASHEEVRMADNYYSILKNRVPEFWFDQGIELGGGQPFTVGIEGDQRNNKHVLRATEYLTNIVESIGPKSNPRFPYVFLGNHPTKHVMKAACGGVACVLETNIDLLPAGLVHSAWHAHDILSVERKNRKILGQEAQVMYLEHPLSKAVDGDPRSFFQSYTDAKSGEYITLDIFSNYHIPEKVMFEMAWLVDINTAHILSSGQFFFSSDGLKWTAEDSKPLCRLMNLRNPIARIADEDVFECSVPFPSVTKAISIPEVRFIRALSGKNTKDGGKWKIYEVWLRHYSIRSGAQGLQTPTPTPTLTGIGHADGTLI